LVENETPKVESFAVTQEYGKFIISPLDGGYGLTLGNALRRVLLSSLEGAAITSIRIDGVHHEFSPIPHAHEDMTRLILNVKRIRLKSRARDSVRLRLEARGAGVITAGDIQCPSDVEILNPGLVLLSLDHEDAELEMEMIAQRGKGYSPTEERDRLPIGDIPVDAIFSPIRKVNYAVEQTRVGRMTDHDRLTLEIWTDGTMGPRDALGQAASILVNHFSLIANFDEEMIEAEEQGAVIPPAVYDTPIEDLELSVRAYNCLKRAGITKVGEILEKLYKGDEEILVIRNFGRKSLDELKEALEVKGFLRPDEVGKDANNVCCFEKEAEPEP
jgi:DNA-directed RNA polymerase subunit alpha